jgi:hypothetical protein
MSDGITESAERSRKLAAWQRQLEGFIDCVRAGGWQSPEWAENPFVREWGHQLASGDPKSWGWFFTMLRGRLPFSTEAVSAWMRLKACSPFADATLLWVVEAESGPRMEGEIERHIREIVLGGSVEAFNFTVSGSTVRLLVRRPPKPRRNRIELEPDGGLF